MSLRTRLLLAFAVVVLIPIALLAFGLRQEMTRRLSDEYQLRVDSRGRGHSRGSRSRERRDRERLASLKSALLNDNRFRLAAVAGVESERNYLLDYAGTAMRLTGLSMLQIQDGDGRIISSGHFRNEHGRVEPGLASALAEARAASRFVTTRAAEREFLALARGESFRHRRPDVHARWWCRRGRSVSRAPGARSSDRRVAALSRRRAFHGAAAIDGDRPGKPATPTDAAVGDLQVPLIRIGRGSTARRRAGAAAGDSAADAAPGAAAQRGFLVSVHRRRDRRHRAAACRVGLVADQQPLAALAEKTAVLDLDRLDVDFDARHRRSRHAVPAAR